MAYALRLCAVDRIFWFRCGVLVLGEEGGERKGFGAACGIDQEQPVGVLVSMAWMDEFRDLCSISGLVVSSVWIRKTKLSLVYATSEASRTP